MDAIDYVLLFLCGALSILTFVGFRRKRQQSLREERRAPVPARAAAQAAPRSHKKQPNSVNDLLAKTFRFVAVDVETANSDQGSICQIGLACVESNGRIHTIGTLIDPESWFDSFNIDLHGIDEDLVEGAPTFDEAFQALRAFLQRHPLIQHSTFDKVAIEKACTRYGVPRPKFDWSDSVRIAQRAWPEFKGNGGHGLAHLKDALGLEFDHHNAEEDAKAAAQIVLLAEQQTGQSFEELSRPVRHVFPKSKAVEGNQSGPLYGHVACFTGKLAMSRTEAATIAAGAGITVKTAVSKKITLLVVGDQDLVATGGNKKSSKHRRAEELIAAGQEIRIIGEAEFLDMVTPE